MIVHALVGDSGTGKSTSALQFADEHHIDAIIDDGLLIVNGQKAAGTSAKFEKNAIKAIRRAIFQDDEHQQEVKEAIKRLPIKSILIIATSEKMAKRIANRLEIAPINHIHFIRDIRTEKEIQVAKFVRNTKGQHVMPIPVRQIEQNFFQRIIRRGKEIFSKNKKVKIGETSIVRPDFHSEVIHIHQDVYIGLIKHSMKAFEKEVKTTNVQFVMNDFQTVVTVTCFIKHPLQYYLPGKLVEVQQHISKEFYKHLEFEPETIHIIVKGVI